MSWQIKAMQIVATATTATDSSLSLEIYSSSTFSSENTVTANEPYTTITYINRATLPQKKSSENWNIPFSGFNNNLINKKPKTKTWQIINVQMAGF